MDRLPYQIFDVFTDRPFTGNPLAVVFDGDRLATEQMQVLAREFHLSETVFLLPAVSTGATYRARIFTPEKELPFAGHPSVGAAIAWAARAGLGAGQVVQECAAGLLPIMVYADARATLTGGRPTLGPPLAPDPLLSMAGLTGADFVGPAPRLAGCGLEFPFLCVTPDAVTRAAGDPAAARAAGRVQISVFAWDAASRTATARVFCPGVGIPEDPATGSAALGLGVWLVGSGLLPGDGESRYTVRQGYEMHRPSTLDCTVTARGGVAEAATVTGQVVTIAEGSVAVPPFVG